MTAVPAELTVSGHLTAPGNEVVRREEKSENHSPLLSFSLIMVSLSLLYLFESKFQSLFIFIYKPLNSGLSGAPSKLSVN